MPGDTMVVRYSDRHNCDDTSEDTIIYVLYDHYAKNWIIRGQRYKDSAFAFVCDDQRAVEIFLSTIYSSSYVTTETLCSFKDLPVDSNNILFQLLEKQYKHNSKDVQIATYDIDTRIKKLCTEKTLRIVRSLYNEYDC